MAVAGFINERDASNDTQLIRNDDDDNDYANINSSDDEAELNKMISNIGFGRYHRRVLALCGLGWLADNMWMQCISCILPRVQRHFSISDARIGLMSSSMFLGLMCGALSWGLVSDKLGRRHAYRWTLVVTSCFGLIACFMPTFGSLCFCLFGIGSGVGGNMPVDGAIFLEFIPSEKRHMLTLLSVFFSLGSVLTASVALAILPPFSCPDNIKDCDVTHQNNGWRYLLIVMSGVTIIMVVLRTVFFRLYETPKFLLQRKGKADVVVVLKKIVRFNGGAMGTAPSDPETQHSSSTIITERTPITNGGEILETTSQSSSTRSSDDVSWLKWPEDIDESHNELLAGHANDTQYSKSQKICSWFKRVKNGNSVREYIRSLEPLFSPYMRKTTILIWLIWTLASLGFTMFNVFLPKLLENRSNDIPSVPNNGPPSHSKQVGVYRDALIYSASGVPGSLVGAWMVDTWLGRKYSMAISTFISGLALIGFAFSAKSNIFALSTIASSVFGLMSTLMYAVIYAYTPEVFHPSIRATGCGSASALGRIAGIVAPLITGLLLELNKSLPMYISVGLLWVATGCMIALPIETRDIVS